jgi:hypothetical protein
VDHSILLSFLEDYIGLSDAVLNMFRTYLKDQTQRISVDNILSKLIFSVGLPQGSVLGPLIFCTYTPPLGAISIATSKVACTL